MITPAEIDLTVQRHAAYPSIDPFQLVDELTEVPVDITGATFTMEVRLYDGAAGDPLLTEALTVASGPRGEYGPPTFDEADHEGLPASNPNDPRPLTSRVRFRYGIKATGIPDMPSPLVVQRGYYIVEEGANG